MAGCVENHITSLIRKIRDVFPPQVDSVGWSEWEVLPSGIST